MESERKKQNIYKKALKMDIAIQIKIDKDIYDKYHIQNELINNINHILKYQFLIECF